VPNTIDCVTCHHRGVMLASFSFRAWAVFIAKVVTGSKNVRLITIGFSPRGTMKRILLSPRLGSLFMFMFMCAGEGFCQEAVTIRIKVGGDATLFSMENKTTTTWKVADRNGFVLKEDWSVTAESREFEETVVKRDVGAKTPVKIERTYSKWQIRNGDKTQVLLVKGQRIVIEKKNGVYQVAYKNGQKVDVKTGEAIIKDVTSRAENRPDIGNLMLPSVPVKPGATWKIEPATIAKVTSKTRGMKYDLAHATGTGKLLKTYMKGGKQFGEMAYELRLPISEINNVDMKDFAWMWLYHTIDCCIDGTSCTGTTRLASTLTILDAHPEAGTIGGPPIGAGLIVTFSDEVVQTQIDRAKHAN
jgi:hypothetical protein